MFQPAATKKGGVLSTCRSIRSLSGYYISMMNRATGIIVGIGGRNVYEWLRTENQEPRTENCRVARGARCQRRVERNSCRSPRGARCSLWSSAPLTIVPIRCVTQGARCQRRVERNSCRSPRGARCSLRSSAPLTIVPIRRVARGARFWSVQSSCISGGLKPCLRSGKPCGLDQPRSARHMARMTETPAPQGLPCARGGLEPARAESRPTTDNVGCPLLPNRHACRSPRGGM